MGKITRVILSPFSWIYALITYFRNHLYNIGYKKSFVFDTMVIGVGNLSLGGNGKTPLVEYLIGFLHGDYKLATLSRGYGRKTRGFRLAADTDDASTLGDEPYQLFLKFRDQVTVAVGEQRVLAIPKILQERPDTEVIIMDDSFQHRSIKPQLNILVSDFNRPFFKDYVIPAGRLRENRNCASRADLIVITKCPADLSHGTIQSYRKIISRYAPQATVHFCYLHYMEPQGVFEDLAWPHQPQVTLVSGIANSEHLERHVSKHFELKAHHRFADHHRYREQEVVNIASNFNSRMDNNRVLLTTEKDMVKLKSFKRAMQDVPVYYLPVEFRFLTESPSFNQVVLNYMEKVDASQG